MPRFLADELDEKRQSKKVVKESKVSATQQKTPLTNKSQSKNNAEVLMLEAQLSNQGNSRMSTYTQRREQETTPVQGESPLDPPPERKPTARHQLPTQLDFPSQIQNITIRASHHHQHYQPSLTVTPHHIIPTIPSHRLTFQSQSHHIYQGKYLSMHHQPHQLEDKFTCQLVQY